MKASKFIVIAAAAAAIGAAIPTVALMTFGSEKELPAMPSGKYEPVAVVTTAALPKETTAAASTTAAEATAYTTAALTAAAPVQTTAAAVTTVAVTAVRLQRHPEPQPHRSRRHPRPQRRRKQRHPGPKASPHRLRNRSLLHSRFRPRTAAPLHTRASSSARILQSWISPARRSAKQSCRS